MKLIIEDDIGQKTVISILHEDTEMIIGRQEGSDIRLNERNVSRNHAKLIRKQGTTVLEDLHSYNGTKVNGNPIQGQIHIQEGDRIELGCFELGIEEDTANIAATSNPLVSCAQTQPPITQKQLEMAFKPTITEPELPFALPKPRRFFWIAGIIGLLVLAGLGWMFYLKKNLAYFENILAHQSLPASPPVADSSFQKSRATTNARTNRLGSQSTVKPHRGSPAKFLESPEEKGRSAPAKHLDYQPNRTYATPTTLTRNGNKLASRPTKTKEAKPNNAHAPVSASVATKTDPNHENQVVQTSDVSVSLQPSAPLNAENSQSSLSPKEKLVEGIRLAQQHRYAQSVVLLEHSLQEDPSLIEAHLWLAKCYHSLKESDTRLIEKVVYHYEKFVRLAPTHPQTPGIIAELKKYSQQRSDH